MKYLLKFNESQILLEDIEDLINDCFVEAIDIGFIVKYKDNYVNIYFDDGIEIDFYWKFGEESIIIKECVLKFIQVCDLVDHLEFYYISDYEGYPNLMTVEDIMNGIIPANKNKDRFKGIISDVDLIRRVNIVFK